ncbi:MAG: retroviral-like aspartic protease family protein, partial [Methylococcales bacterium]|nr:retroviral-like aspartic protease family protein [Methylococcales bacterium]
MSQKIGQVMIYMAWMLLLVVLTIAANSWLETQQNPNQNLEIQYDHDRIPEVTLKQNRYGHYVATGKINDQKVNFLLDTGATSISIPQAVADNLQLTSGYPTKVNTANGTITVYSTVLKKVSLGAITLTNLRGHINPYMEGDEILLGMTFIRHLELIQ